MKQALIDFGFVEDASNKGEFDMQVIGKVTVKLDGDLIWITDTKTSRTLAIECKITSISE